MKLNLKSLLIVFLLSLSVSSKGQTYKKGIMIGGYVSLGSDWVSTSSNDIYTTTGDNKINISREFSFNINPTFGYFFTDDVGVGIIISYNYSNLQYIDEYDEEVLDVTHNISASPFLRLYLIDTDVIRPFIQGDIGVGYYSLSNRYAHYFRYSVGGGVSFFIYDFVSIDLSAYYRNTTLENNGGDKFVSQRINLDVGFHIYL